MVGKGQGREVWLPCTSGGGTAPGWIPASWAGPQHPSSGWIQVLGWFPESWAGLDPSVPDLLPACAALAPGAPWAVSRQPAWPWLHFRHPHKRVKLHGGCRWREGGMHRCTDGCTCARCMDGRMHVCTMHGRTDGQTASCQGQAEPRGPRGISEVARRSSEPR